MPDDINNILAYLAQAQQPQASPAPNILQQLASGGMAAPASADQAPQGNFGPNLVPNGPAPQLTAQPDIAASAPRERRSVLDVLGRISDVIAKTGGAEAQYQPTLDARQDRQLSLENNQLDKTLKQFQINGAGLDLDTKRRTVLGQGIRGLKAIVAGGGSAVAAWPQIAKQIGIPDDKIAEIGQQLAADPEGTMAGLEAATQDPKLAAFGKQAQVGLDAEGNPVYFQVDAQGNQHIIQGLQAPNPVTTVNTGGSTVGIGKVTGRPTIILPNSEKPGGALDRSSRENIAAGRNATQVQIAGMPARAKAPAATAATDGANARSMLGELRSTYNSLNDMGAIVNGKRSKFENARISALQTSKIGQMIGDATGDQAQILRQSILNARPALMQQIAKATGMTGKQLDSNSDVKLFMQTVTNPASSYEANIAAINRLDKLLTPKKTAPAATSPPAARKSGPSVSNW